MFTILSTPQLAPFSNFHSFRRRLTSKLNEARIFIKNTFLNLLCKRYIKVKWSLLHQGFRCLVNIFYLDLTKRSYPIIELLFIMIPHQFSWVNHKKSFRYCFCSFFTLFVNDVTVQSYITVIDQFVLHLFGNQAMHLLKR